MALVLTGFIMVVFNNYLSNLNYWWILGLAWFFGMLHALSTLFDNPLLNEYEQTFGTLFGVSIGVIAVLFYLLVMTPPPA